MVAFGSVVGDVAGCVAAVAAIVGLPMIYVQIRAARRATEGESLTNIAALASNYGPIHTRLRTGRARWWADADSPAPSDDDMVELEGYMGLVERIGILVDNKALKLDVVDRLYSYRVALIVNNDWIRTHKIEPKRADWVDFIKLWSALKAHREAHGRRQFFRHEPPDLDRPAPDDEQPASLPPAASSGPAPAEATDSPSA